MIMFIDNEGGPKFIYLGEYTGFLERKGDSGQKGEILLQQNLQL